MQSFKFLLISVLFSSTFAGPLVARFEHDENAGSTFDENPRIFLESREGDVAEAFADFQPREIMIKKGFANMEEIREKRTGQDFSNGIYAGGVEASEHIQGLDTRELKKANKIYYPSQSQDFEADEGANDLQTRTFEFDQDFVNIKNRYEKRDKKSTSSSKGRVNKEKGEIKNIQSEQRKQHQSAREKEDHERAEIEEARRKQKAATSSRDKQKAKNEKSQEQAELNAVKKQNQRDKERLQREKEKEKKELEEAKRGKKIN
ncbi:ec9 protein [Colletotrichum incanum]|uniref:Ec9 protein n=1 Tax=Colletotrichum incanum TaxID=1573173 RepID=A0A167B6K5_COLIC|nr:ec9 protein [Colletotrichum incanum]